MKFEESDDSYEWIINGIDMNQKAKEKLNFIDLFAGVGGFRLGMEQAGHTCKAFCEIDKFARESYKAIHNTEGEMEMHDITKISDDTIRGIGVGSIDIICGGFPCQAFSIAGKRRGFEDTRGTLFFEIARFASILRPRYLFLENVKGLLNHEGGTTFEVILRTLDELGYDAEWHVLNSKLYVPQNRERIFIIGHLRGQRTTKIFPFKREEATIDIKQPGITIIGTTNKHNDLTTHTRERTFSVDGIMGALTATDYKSPKQIVVGNTNPSGKGMNGNVFKSAGLSPTLTTNNGEGTKVAIPVLSPDKVETRQNGRRFKNNDEEMFTLTTQDRHGVMVMGNLPGNYKQSKRVYDSEGICPALMTMQGGDQQPKIALKIREATTKGYSEAKSGDSINISHPNSSTRRGRVGSEIANTLLTGEEQAIVMDDFQIRKLTPLECWRLQAWPDELFFRAKFGSVEIAKRIVKENLNHYECGFEQVMSNSQLYKQAGNGVTVSVIYDIAKRF